MRNIKTYNDYNDYEVIEDLIYCCIEDPFNIVEVDIGNRSSIFNSLEIPENKNGIWYIKKGDHAADHNTYNIYIKYENIKKSEFNSNMSSFKRRLNNYGFNVNGHSTRQIEGVNLYYIRIYFSK